MTNETWWCWLEAAADHPDGVHRIPRDEYERENLFSWKIDRLIRDKLIFSGSYSPHDQTFCIWLTPTGRELVEKLRERDRARNIATGKITGRIISLD